MKRTGIKTLLLSCFYGWGSAVIVLAFVLRNGNAPFAIPEILPIVLVVLAVGVFAWGRIVRDGQTKDEHGQRKRDVSPLHAARVAILCQACIRCGAGFFGFFGMCALLFLRTGSTHYVHHQVLIALLTALASCVLAVAAWFGEKNCVSGGSGKDGQGSSGASGAASAA